MTDTSTITTERPATTARDSQRAALADLVQLLRDCALAEAKIEAEHQQHIEHADKELDRAKLQAEHQLSSRGQEMLSGYEKKLADTVARHESDAANTTEADRVRRIRIKGEFEVVSRDVKKQLDHAIWLADSVADGTAAKVKSDTRKAKEEQITDNAALDELDEAATALLEKFGYRVAAPDATPAPKDNQTPPAELFKIYQKQAEDQLAQLKSLSLPHLMVGVTPWLLGMLLVGASGAAGKFGLAGKMPDWQAIAAGAGAGIVIATVLGIIMNLTAKSQVRQALAPFREAMAGARATSDRKLTETRARLEAQLQKSTQQREVEIRAAKDRAEPTLARAKSKYDEAIAALDRELQSKLAHVNERRHKLKSDADSEYEQTSSSLRSKIEHDLAAAADRHTKRRAEIGEHHAAARAQLNERWKDGLDQIQRSIEQKSSGSNGDAAIMPHSSLLLDFSDDSIARWKAPTTFPATVRFGQLEVDAKQLLAHLPEDTRFTLELPEKFQLPAVLALPRQASLVIQADRAGRAAAVGALQMLMTRLLTSVPPGRAKFTIIDPVALGQNFAGFMHLADYDESLVASRIWTDPEHIEQRLTDLTEHMETVIQKYLRNEFQTIDDYNRQAGELAEPYRFLVISDFPHGFGQESLRRLASIASTGARCGVYVLIHRDTRQPIPAGSGFDDVEAHSVNLVQNGERFTWRDDVFQQFPLTLDAPPGEEQLTRLMHTVGKLARDANRVEVSFKTIAPKKPEFWTLSAKSELRVPIGRMGATRQQMLRLGKGVAQHALIAGKTGSGKSTLLHAIITNIAMWYAPDEVELYLIDFKKGVEFKAYASNNLPHARAIAVESDREFGLSVLQRIDAEMTRRGELFRKLGVQDLGAYRDTVASDEATKRQSDEGQSPDSDSFASSLRRSVAVLPRVLLIIDEFQEFFSEDDKLGQDAALLIDRLVRQGRAFGIHVLLGSQTIGGSGGLSRSTLGQMAVRVALQCSEADSQLILGDNNSAARLLTRPGEAIYNDAGGLVEGNSPFQVAWLPDEQRDDFLGEVSQLVEASPQRPKLAAPIVFEGNAPADIRKNVRLSRILRGEEQPNVPIAFLGEPVAIKDPTAISFRRQAGAHVMVVGQSEEQALAMMMSMSVSLSASLRGKPAKFYLFDGTAADSPYAGRLGSVAPHMSHELKQVEYRAAAEAIGEIATELKRRQEADDAAAEPIFLLIHGLQRYRALRKTEESFSFGSEEKPPAPDKQFNEILREGPSLGIHVIAWADTAVSIDRTIERNALREFDNRILMQMSAADSSTLIDSPAANKLGFYRAIAYSEEQGTIEKFRPYGVWDGAWWK